MDIEFGNEYRTYGVGLGGYIEGMERGGVAIIFYSILL